MLSRNYNIIKCTFAQRRLFLLGDSDNNENKCRSIWICIFCSQQYYRLKNEMFHQQAWNDKWRRARLHSPSSLMRCCLLRRESRSKEKSDHSSRGGKEMVWRRVKRTASMTRSPRASEEPMLTVEAPLVRTMWGGGEKSMACRCSMIPFQMMCWNSEGIFSLDKS